MLYGITVIITVNDIALEGFEPSEVMMKTLCRNHLTIRPLIFYL